MLLIEPFQYAFFVRGLIAAGLVCGLCGIIGVYVVLRGMSYIGHGLSHSVFGGAVVSYILSINFYLGAGAWGVLSAILINQAAKKRGIGADAAIGIVTTASFAIGVALISRYRRFTKNFEAALFGNILGVTPDDLIAIAAISALVLAMLFLVYKQLLFVTFDPEVARIYGVPADWIDTLFALILAGTIITSMQVIGVTLIAATLVVPAVVARLLTDSFHRMVLLSGVLGALSGITGLYLSYYLDVSSGATIVLTESALFCLVLAGTHLRRRLVVRNAIAARRPAAAFPEGRDLLD